MGIHREQAEDLSQYQRYLDRLQDVPEGLTRDEIYEGLQERIPHLQRKQCTPRVFEESGVNPLLDQLIQIQYTESLSMLEEEANK